MSFRYGEFMSHKSKLQGATKNFWMGNSKPIVIVLAYPQLLTTMELNSQRSSTISVSYMLTRSSWLLTPCWRNTLKSTSRSFNRNNWHKHYLKMLSILLLKVYMWLLKGYRVVCSAVHFSCDDTLNKFNGIMDDAVYLRAASQSVCILNFIAEPMTFWRKNKEVYDNKFPTTPLYFILFHSRRHCYLTVVWLTQTVLCKTESCVQIR